MSTPSPWRYFSVEELRCKCGCGRWDMDHVYMDRLVALREDLGFPFPINSAYRCVEYDQSIGGAGVHPTGHATDIGVSGHQALQLVSRATAHGMTGVGVKQKGTGRFVHLDDLQPEEHPPRPWIWTY